MLRVSVPELISSPEATNQPMAPTKPKPRSSNRVKENHSKQPKGKDTKPSKSGRNSNAKKHKKSAVVRKQKKPRVYTERQLNIQPLNTAAIPGGVAKPLGKKKGKVFVQDIDTMMAILQTVNDTKDSQIQTKMEKTRQLEAIREARKLETEAKDTQKKGALEAKKKYLKKGRKRDVKDDPQAVPTRGKKVKFA